MISHSRSVSTGYVSGQLGEFNVSLSGGGIRYVSSNLGVSLNGGGVRLGVTGSGHLFPLSTVPSGHIHS